MQPAMAEISLAAAVCLVLMIDVFAGVKRRGVTLIATLIALAVWLGMRRLHRRALASAD